MDSTKNNMPAVWLVAVVFFMELLDTTIINTSIPNIAISFSVEPITIKTAITSYLIALAIFIPISGWLADKFGIKTIFSLAILIFTISSLLCGLSHSIYELSLFRALQGFGGAMMAPVGRLIIIRSFGPSDLVKVMSYVSIPALFGPVMGPLLGGFISTYYSWHWIFFINIPIGMICFILAQKFIVNDKVQKNPPLDIKGFILTAVAFSFLSFGFENLSENLISKFIIYILLFIGLVSLILYFMHFKHTQNPLLDFKLFKINPFLIANIQIFLTIISMGGMSFLLPILFQSQFGLTPLQSGLMTFPIAVGSLSVRFFVPKIIKYFDYKKTLIINSVLCSISLLSFTLINSINHVLIIIIGFIFGCLYILQISTVIPLGYIEIKNEQKSKATSLQATMQQLSMSFGICLCALILNILLSNFNSTLGNLSDTKNVVLIFHYCFIIMSAINLLNLIPTAFLKLKKEI